MSGSLNRKEGSQSVRNQVRKTRNQKEIVMKKIPDEEDKKTVMLMENRKRKGRLGSGALGPNSDPNPEVPLKIIIKMKHTKVPKFINMLDDRVTGVKTAESILKELGVKPTIKTKEHTINLSLARLSRLS